MSEDGSTVQCSRGNEKEMAVAVKGSWAKPSSGSRFLLPYVVCPAGTASGGPGTLIEHEGIPVSIKCK